MESKGRNTVYYHGIGSNKVYAKLTNVRSLVDEMETLIGDNGYRNTVWAIENVDGKIYDKVSPRYDEKYYGVACCDDRDEFNLGKGNKIASLKADLKYHDRRCKDYTALINGLNKLIAILNNAKQKHIGCYNRIYDRLVKDYGWKDNA